MVFFCDKYTGNVEKLEETIRAIELNGKIVVLEDEGFLPDGILSPYEYFISCQAHDEFVERELFFNMLKIPEYWKTLVINWTSGGIYDMDQKKATVYFTEPYEKRNVRRVEWHTESKRVYKVDYYNKYGLKYAGEFRNPEGNIDSKVFYSDRNEEIIVEQPKSGVIMLLERGSVKAFFTSYGQFINYYVEEAGLEGEQYVLFLQEESRFSLLDLAPGGKNTWKYVLFSDQALLDKYIGMGGKNGCRFYGIPENYPVNHAKGEAFILTASDQIEGIEELIQELPEITFHVAAHTQVSDKVLRLGEQGNVNIYPQISLQNLQNLWEKCDFYLDINHYREIHDAINMAHWHNLLIMGFENTVHHRELMIEEFVFPGQDVKGMSVRIKELLDNPDRVETLLERQQRKKYVIWQRMLE